MWWQSLTLTFHHKPLNAQVSHHNSQIRVVPQFPNALLICVSSVLYTPSYLTEDNKPSASWSLTVLSAPWPVFTVALLLCKFLILLLLSTVLCVFWWCPHPSPPSLILRCVTVGYAVIKPIVSPPRSVPFECISMLVKQQSHSAMWLRSEDDVLGNCHGGSCACNEKKKNDAALFIQMLPTHCRVKQTKAPQWAH